MTLEIKSLVVGPIDVNCYVIWSKESLKEAIIDPGDDAEKIHKLISSETISPEYIILTHGHWDHIGAVKQIKEMYKAKIAIHKDDLEFYSHASEIAEIFGFEVNNQPPVDLYIKDNDNICIDGVKLTVLHTPGHSQGSVSLLSKSHIFTGDLIFAGSVGRTDLPGGSEKSLKESIRKKILSLPDETIIFPGHGDKTTVGYERRHNTFLQDERC